MSEIEIRMRCLCMARDGDTSGNIGKILSDAARMEQFVRTGREAGVLQYQSGIGAVSASHVGHLRGEASE